MKTIKEVKEMLETVDGFSGKVAFYEFPDGQAPDLPFMCFVVNDYDNFGADGIVYYSFGRFAIELYTKYRDEDIENELEETLTENNIYYTKQASYIDSEFVWLTVYEMEL